MSIIDCIWYDGTGLQEGKSLQCVEAKHCCWGRTSIRNLQNGEESFAVLVSMSIIRGGGGPVSWAREKGLISALISGLI